MDEGLSIGIASQPFFDIPGVLRQDGSPPLYYLTLHVWMEVFGNGPADTQGLSVAISLLAVPGGLWAGWTLFGKRAGLICAALGAFNPFLTVYAQETRMYSLMVVLSLLLSAAFLHVFVFRRREYLPLLRRAARGHPLHPQLGHLRHRGHARGARASPFLATDDRRGVAQGRGRSATAPRSLLYMPWLPTLLYQTAHTGAPWLNSPRLGAPVQISKGLLGGGTVTVALLLAAGSGPGGGAHAEDRRATRSATAVLTALTIGVATLAVAWLFSQVSPAWTTRYLGVALGRSSCWPRSASRAPATSGSWPW